MRTTADHVLAGALGLALEPLPGQSRPPACRPGSRSSGSASTEVPEGGGTLLVRSDVAAPVTLGRFADQPSVPLGDVGAATWTRLSIPGDHATTPWLVQVDGGGPGNRVCLESAAGS